MNSRKKLIRNFICFVLVTLLAAVLVTGLIKANENTEALMFGLINRMTFAP